MLSPLSSWASFSADEQARACYWCSATQVADIRSTVLGLINQIMYAQRQDGNSGREVNYWLSDRYQKELGESPLERGEDKFFRVIDSRVPNMHVETHAVYRELWRIFSTMLDYEQLVLFKGIRFYHSDRDEYTALLYQDLSRREGAIRERWELEINLANVSLSNPMEYNKAVEALAHEAGHFLAMNATQVDFFVPEETCFTYYIAGIGSCAREGSYYDVLSPYWNYEFSRWGEQFWDSFVEEERSTREILQYYYSASYDTYVSPYAAAGPDEDTAETIMFMARYPLPREITTQSDEKIMLLYAFPEMQTFRERVQSLLK